MKLRIIEAGWETFAGDFGGVPFEAGVSLRDVTELEAMRLSNAIRIETLEGKNPSSSQQALESITTPMSVEVPITSAEVEAPKPAVAGYTRAQLEAIADAKGIEGLREIGRVVGVSSRSINGLMDLVINAQGGEPIEGKLQAQALVGSSKFPTVFELDGYSIALGTVVRSAFEQYEKTGKTVADWNDQPAELRDELIAGEVAVLRN